MKAATESIASAFETGALIHCDFVGRPRRPKRSALPPRWRTVEPRGGDPHISTIPRERVERLFALALEAARAGEEERARRYVRRARTVAQRHRLSLPREVRRRTCDACDRVLLPGRNARVRTRGGHVVVTCDCGEQARYPYD